MKNNTLFGLIFILAAASIISCDRGFGKDVQNDEIDSTSIVETRLQDSINNVWLEDSLNMVKHTTLDLSLFEVHGPVKQIVEYRKYDGSDPFKYATYEFDSIGKFIKLDGRNPFTYVEYPDENVYERDGNGRISERHESEYREIYIWKDNRIIGYKWGSDGYYGEDSYVYNDSGFIAKLESKTLGGPIEEEEYETIITDYTYPEVDEYGNWTNRKGGNYEIKREITYYPIKRDDEKYKPKASSDLPQTTSVEQHSSTKKFTYRFSTETIETIETHHN